MFVGDNTNKGGEIDQPTLQRLNEIAKLPEEGKQQIFMVVDALIRDFRTKQAYS